MYSPFNQKIWQNKVHHKVKNICLSLKQKSGLCVLYTFLYNLLLISCEPIFIVFCSILIAWTISSWIIGLCTILLVHAQMICQRTKSPPNLRHTQVLEVMSINTFVTDWMRKDIGLINLIAYINWSTKYISVYSQLQT